MTPAPDAIFWPAVAMVALTVVVTFRMYRERLRQIRGEGIGFAEIPSSSQMAARLADTRAADNYRNLFETPVLFYLALVVAHATGQVTWAVLGLAWAYVALRVVHSWIHCTYNRIRHRLNAFLASCVALWVIWTLLAIGLAWR